MEAKCGSISHFTFFSDKKTSARGPEESSKAFFSRARERKKKPIAGRRSLKEAGKEERKERREQKQIRLKSFVIKSKLTFRTKLCYPPNLHFSLTNTEASFKIKAQRATSFCMKCDGASTGALVTTSHEWARRR